MRMKRILFTFIGLWLMAVAPLRAMSYERAEQEARFLTDKMAYELGLSDYQYERAYRVNFDYFYNLNDASDFYGDYWRTRNTALEAIFNLTQWGRYCRLGYFYRPVRLYRNRWDFPIYARYHRTRFYRPSPAKPPRPGRPGMPDRPGNGFHFGGSPSRPGRPEGPHFGGGLRPSFTESRPSRPSFGGDRRPQGENRPSFRKNDFSNRPSTRSYGRPSDAGGRKMRGRWM